MEQLIERGSEQMLYATVHFQMLPSGFQKARKRSGRKRKARHIQLI
jgi:hypothetical protein